MPQQNPQSSLEHAWHCLSQGEVEEADKAVQEALSLYDRFGDVVGQAHAGRAAVRVMLARGQTAEAVAEAKERLQAVRRSGERSLEMLRRREAPLLLATAEAQLAAKEPEAAVTAAGKAMNFFKGLGEQHGAAEAKLVMARAQLPQAKEAAASAADAAKDFAAMGDRGKEAEALQVLVEIHESAADYAAVIRAAAAAKGVLEDVGNKVGLARLHLSIAHANFASGDQDEALASARQAVMQFQAAGRKKDAADAALLAARSHQSQQEYSHAVIMAKQALSLFAEMQDRKGQASAESQVAQILMQSGKLDEAKRHAQSAHTLYKELQDAAGKKEANEMLCTLELAPDIIELRQAKVRSLIRKLARTVAAREGEAFEEALRDLRKKDLESMFSIADVKAALEPHLAEDPTGTIRFVRRHALGWSELEELEPPKASGLKDWTLRFFAEK